MQNTFKTFIFTEAVNCGKIARIALESFHRHHDLQVHIFGTDQDFNEMGDIVNHKNSFPIVIDDPVMLEAFTKGHLGTAMLFAEVLRNFTTNKITNFSHVIHFDSDVYFKKECVSIIEQAFTDGYSIIGSRRCFGNNPSGVPGLEGFPDTVSTYFLGINKDAIPVQTQDDLIKYCQGVKQYKDIPILDFFDPITQMIIANGGKALYLDSNIAGGQDRYGKKMNMYRTNMHMDCGEYLVHFGGVGTGLSAYQMKSTPEVGYTKWAVGRYMLFAKLFYNEEIHVVDFPGAEYGPDGRWVSGTYDEKILSQVKNDMK